MTCSCSRRRDQMAMAASSSSSEREKKMNGRNRKLSLWPPIHSYNTRSKLRRCSQGFVTEYNAWNQGLVACAKRRKRKRATPTLPEDVILSLLLLLPAKVLYGEMRRVCRGWYNTINDPAFISAHLQMSLSSPTGLLVQDRAHQDLALYIETHGAELKLTELRMPFPANILGSCRGLVLLHDWTNLELFHLVNLITKEIVGLPPMPGLTKFNGRYTALSYASSSGHYKVVHLSGDFNSEMHLMICTVGVDRAWRKLDLDGISMTEHVKDVLMSHPIAVAGFICWLRGKCPFRFALDVDAEKMYQFPTPEGYYNYRADTDLRANMNLETGLGYKSFIEDMGTERRKIW